MKLNNTYLTTDFNIADTALAIHPHSEEILQKAKRLSMELGIYSEAFYNGHHTMTPYIFPDSDIERTVIATVWFSTLYFLDDFFGEDMHSEGERPDMSALFTAWTRGVVDEDAQRPEKFHILFKAVAYCSQQIQSKSTPEFFTRYTQNLYHHMQHTLHPVQYTSVEEYIGSRIHFGGMYPTMGMIEFVNGVYLNENLATFGSALVEAERACALIGVLSNDLISYHKEKHSQQNLLNAYLRMQVAQDLDEAIQMGLERVNTAYQEFVKQCRRAEVQWLALPAEEKHTAEVYMAGMERLIGASYHWQVRTNRYRSADNVFADLTHQIDEEEVMVK